MLRVPSLVLALLAASCARRPPEDGKVVLRLGWSNEAAGIRPVVTRFEEAHPGIRVEVRTYPAAGGQATYENKIRNDLRAKDGPDVFALPDKEAPAFAHQGFVLDLKPLCEAPGGLPLDDFYPLALASWTYDGGLAGIPYQWAVGVLVVNADLFEREGIPLDDDWDWDRFAEVCRRLTRDTDGDGRIDRYACRRAFSDYALVPVWASGGEVLDASGARVLLGSPEAKRGIRWYCSLFLPGPGGGPPAMVPFAEDMATVNEAVDLFASGRVAMMEAGNWFVRFQDQVQTFRWEILRFPRCPATGRRATRIAVDAVAVWKGTPHPKEAFELAKAFASVPWQRATGQAGEFIPVRRSIAESEAFVRPDTPWDERRFLRAAEDGRVFPRIPEFNVLRRSLGGRLEAVWIPPQLGRGPGESPDAAADRIAADLQKAIDGRARDMGPSRFRAAP